MYLRKWESRETIPFFMPARQLKTPDTAQEKRPTTMCEPLFGMPHHHVDDERQVRR